MRPSHRNRPPRARSVRNWPFAHVLAALAFGTALGACFNPPAAATMFSCDAKDAPECPAGYSCEADGCCHRDGTDVAAQFGACGLGGPGDSGMGTGTDTAPTGSSGDVSSSGPDATLTGTSTGDTATSTGSTTGSTTSGTSDTGSSDTGSSATGSSDTGSSSASTGP